MRWIIVSTVWGLSLVSTACGKVESAIDSLSGSTVGSDSTNVRGSNNGPVLPPTVLGGQLQPVQAIFRQVPSDLQYVTIHDGDVVTVEKKSPVQAQFSFAAVDNDPANRDAKLVLTLPPGNDNIELSAFCLDYLPENSNHGCWAAIIGYKDKVTSGDINSLGLDQIPAGSYQISITYANGATRSLHFSVAPQVN